MNRHTLAVVFLAVVMILSAFAPVGAATASEDESDDGLSIDVEQNGDVLVTVTENSTAVENATLEVTTTDDNDSYEGVGNDTTDDNGTVTLPEPNETVSVDLEATVDNDSVTTTETLEAAADEDDDEETDDADEDVSFGSLVSAFVHDAQNDSNGVNGTTVAQFVVENNPGNAPDHAGPPAHAGPSDADNDSEQGPPDHAGPPSDDSNDSDNGNDSDDSDDSSGPPDHAGPPSDDDNGDDAANESDS